MMIKCAGDMALGIPPRPAVVIIAGQSLCIQCLVAEFGATLNLKEGYAKYLINNFGENNAIQD